MSEIGVVSAWRMACDDCVRGRDLKTIGPMVPNGDAPCVLCGAMLGVDERGRRRGHPIQIYRRRDEQW